MRIVEIIDKHLALLGFICKVHASSLGEGLEGRKSKALDGPVVHLQEVVVDDHLDLANAARPLVQPKHHEYVLWLVICSQIKYVLLSKVQKIDTVMCLECMLNTYFCF